MSNVLRNSRSGSAKFGLYRALASGALMLPAAGRAADRPAFERTGDLRMQLAASGKTLSADAMEKQKDAGRSPASLIDQRMDGFPRVLLWDEMRIWSMLKRAGDGVVDRGRDGPSPSACWTTVMRSWRTPKAAAAAVTGLRKMLDKIGEKGGKRIHSRACFRQPKSLFPPETIPVMNDLHSTRRRLDAAQNRDDGKIRECGYCAGAPA